MAKIGYARVSTEEQTTDPQIGELKRAGCTVILREHASGSSKTRPELKRALEMVKKGDTLIVVRIDRLARSLGHLLEIIETLDAKGVGFRSLGDPIDTTNAQGRFTMQILGAVAEFERALIRERTKSGLKSARAQGRVGGNPGLKIGDPIAIRKMIEARDERRSRDVIARSQDFLPIVRNYRSSCNWDQIVLILNARKIVRPGDGGLWNRDGLIRAVKRLVREGLAEAELLKPSPRSSTSDDLVDTVALLANTLDKPTLSNISNALQKNRVRSPRGGLTWGPSSVKNLLDQAKSKGLVHNKEPGME